jgi:hypothetical protein
MVLAVAGLSCTVGFIGFNANELHVVGSPKLRVSLPPFAGSQHPNGESDRDLSGATMHRPGSVVAELSLPPSVVTPTGTWSGNHTPHIKSPPDPRTKGVFESKSKSTSKANVKLSDGDDGDGSERKKRKKPTQCKLLNGGAKGRPMTSGETHDSSGDR